VFRVARVWDVRTFVYHYVLEDARLKNRLKDTKHLSGGESHDAICKAVCKHPPKVHSRVILDAGLPLGLSISGMVSWLKLSESNETPESTVVHSNEDDSPNCRGPKVHGLNFFSSPPQHARPSSPAPHLHHHCAHLVCSAGLI
jgi:hypothetical protein